MFWGSLIPSPFPSGGWQGAGRTGIGLVCCYCLRKQLGARSGWKMLGWLTVTMGSREEQQLDELALWGAGPMKLAGPGSARWIELCGLPSRSPRRKAWTQDSPLPAIVVHSYGSQRGHLATVPVSPPIPGESRPILASHQTKRSPSSRIPPSLTENSHSRPNPPSCIYWSKAGNIMSQMSFGRKKKNLPSATTDRPFSVQF